MDQVSICLQPHSPFRLPLTVFHCLLDLFIKFRITFFYMLIKLRLAGHKYIISVAFHHINDCGKTSLSLLSGLGHSPKPCHVDMGMTDTADNTFRLSAELLIKFFFQIVSGSFYTVVIFFRIYFPQIQSKKSLVQTIPNLNIIIGFLS